VLLAMRRTSMSELESRVDLAADPEIAQLVPWKASHVRALAERLNAIAPRLDGLRVVLAVLEVHDLVRDALARVLPAAGAEVILLGSNAPIDGIVRAAIEEDADAIVLGVYNGNALALGERLARGASAAGWTGTIYMGGILNQDTGHGLPIDVRPALATMGVRCVDSADELLQLLVPG
jgi:methylmalonyl-CoA mutase cobalamin-binding subunit